MIQSTKKSQEYPNAAGRFGSFGGVFAPESLMFALELLENEYLAARQDPLFQRQLDDLLKDFVGRETPLYYARNLSEHFGAKIYLKREDLAHTGAHKINNAIGQALLTKRMGKQRVIAETGAGQHGVATAAACALLGLECVIYMGVEDIRRQTLNAFRIRLMGAEVCAVESGSKTLKDAINEAMRDWVTNAQTTHYLIGSAVGPHPFPRIVRDFQSVIGKEARRQILAAEGRLPDKVIACVGGGSNAIGIFHPFIDDAAVELIGVEAGGSGPEPGHNAASLTYGSPGALHGSYSYVLQNDDGQILETQSVSAGLDYPGVGPEHSMLKETGRARYTTIEDVAALAAFQALCRMEGIIPALESAHAIAELFALRENGGLRAGEIIIVNLSGRGDKDMNTAASALGVSL